MPEQHVSNVQTVEESAASGERNARLTGEQEEAATPTSASPSKRASGGTRSSSRKSAQQQASSTEETPSSTPPPKKTRKQTPASSHPAANGTKQTSKTRKAPVTQEETKPKKAPRAKKATGSRPRSTREREQTAEAVKQRAFEPEADVTPIKPRTARDASRRATLFDDALIETARIEIELDSSPFEMEETLKRPAAFAPPPQAVTPEITETPLPTIHAPEELTIPETPRPTIHEPEELTIPETPRPTIHEPEALPIPETPRPAPEQEDLPASLEMEQEQAARVAVMERLEIAVEETITVSQVEVETPPPPAAPSQQTERATVGAPRARPRISWQLSRGRVAALLLLVVVLCTIPLWRDVQDTHLYLYTVNPLDGQVQGQQDLGGGYADVSALTNPVAWQSSLRVGLESAQANQQRVLTLSGSAASWTPAQPIDAPTTRATLGVTPGGQFVVAYARGVQVLNSDGSLLWQTSEDAPTLGAHVFAPIFDANTLYTINAAQGGVIAAYALRDGPLRWTQRLDDTLNYAPPLMLNNGLLFVAGDHTLYALNAASGQVVWKTFAPTRTMLVTQSGLLISVGAAGIQAFDEHNGQVAWSFNGHPSADLDSHALTNAQFYEADISSANQVIYATGIVWDADQVRQQLWLFAIDASTGAMRWSESVGNSPASADAGRVLSPFADTAHGLVLLEQAHADGSHSLTAYATGDGKELWRTRLAGVTAYSSSSPVLFQAAGGSIGLFSAQKDAGTALHAWSWLRLLLFLLGSASILLLFALWIVPLTMWAKRTRTALKLLRRWLLAPFKMPRRRSTRIAAVCGLSALLIITAVVSVSWMKRPQVSLTQIQGNNGQTQWQHALSTPTTPGAADSLGSLVLQQSKDSLSTVVALNTDGSTRWSTFASEGQFSLPSVSVEPGTVLVALSGRTQALYTSAPSDIAYQRPLDSLYTLILYDRLTGKVIWQHSIVSGGAKQQTTVLGADAQYIYVASRSTPPLAGSQQPAATVQLIAVDRASGDIVWRVYGPHEEQTAQPDFGALLSQGRLLYWQVANTVMALDTQLGQIQWRRYIAEQNPTGSANEESQMVQSASFLLITRSDQYHALDPITGNEDWTIATPGSNMPQTAGGIVATGHEFILYGNGAIEAIDASSHNVIWQHTNLLNVSNVMVSPDGSLIYALVLDNIDGETPRQSLVAFDASDSAVRWTFQPSPQANFSYPGVPTPRFAHGLLFVTLCFSSTTSACSAQALYGINGTNGSVSWEFDASHVSQVQISQDGNVIVFEDNRSVWENIRSHFQG